jgi:hypothetical protein
MGNQGTYSGAFRRALANFDGYAGCADESQIRDFSVRAGPTQYVRNPIC